jgi:SAM-dependent methyltransferase
MDDAAIRDFWEKYPCGDVLVGRLADRYDGDHRRFFDAYDKFRYDMEDHIPRCLDEIDFAGKRVLDIGLGQGADSEGIVRRGALWTGLDLTQEAVDRVGARMKLRGLKIEGLHRGTMMAMPFADATFDMIFSHGALPTVPDTRGAQKEFARVLKPGGKLIVMVYAAGSLNYLLAIGVLRRLGLIFLYYTGLRLGGLYDVHVEQAKSQGLWRYLKMENFIHRNTDGPYNPYIRVHWKRDIAREFPDFRVERMHKEFMWAPPLPVKRLSFLAPFMGWHLWVHMEKK